MDDMLQTINKYLYLYWGSIEVCSAFYHFPAKSSSLVFNWKKSYKSFHIQKLKHESKSQKSFIERYRTCYK